MEQSVLERFWSKVQKTAGCWLWTAGRSDRGYGGFWLDGRTITAQRAAWMLTRGEIPSGMVVRHDCDNPQCVRPDHLRLGTQKENMLDKLARGRCIRGDQHYSRISPEKLAYGERHHKARLTTELVIEIRRVFASGTITISELARRYPAGRKSIEAVVKRQTWKHVPDEAISNVNHSSVY